MSAEMLNDIKAQQVGVLEFGAGKIGGELSPKETAEVQQNLGVHTAEVTVHNTAGCGDGRPTVELADGTRGEALETRVEPQLFGGVGLAATKAAVAANLPIVRNAADVWEAYLIVSRHLQENGYEDGGHKGCGASATVKSSVELHVDMEKLTPAVQALVPGDDVSELLAAIDANKQARLLAGFYDGWDQHAHEQYLTQHFPHNFATLDAPHDHDLHGHEEDAIYAVSRQGYGFAKNQYVHRANGQAFGLTPWFAAEIAPLFGATEQEQRMFMVALADDTWHVGAGLTATGTPIFAAS